MSCISPTMPSKFSPSSLDSRLRYKNDRLNMRSPRMEISRSETGKRQSTETEPSSGLSSGVSEETRSEESMGFGEKAHGGGGSGSRGSSGGGGESLGQLGEDLWRRDCDYLLGPEKESDCGQIDDKDNFPETHTQENHEAAGQAVWTDEEEPRISIRRALEGVRLQLSTDSSVHACSSVTNPNADQLLYCLAIAIQAQVYDDYAASAELPEMHPEFCLNARYFPAADMDLCAVEAPAPMEAFEVNMAGLSGSNMDMLEKIRAGAVPTLDVVYRFLVDCYNKKHYSDECNIIAIIYLYRMLSPNLPLSNRNWRSLWVVAVILAQKMWSDLPLRTSEFVNLLTGVTKRQLSQMEIKAMDLLNYTTCISPSLYAKYYFQLRKIMKEAMTEGGSKPGCDEVLSKPLSLIQAKQLVYRSSRPVMRRGPSRSSSVVGSVGGHSSSRTYVSRRVDGSISSISNSQRSQSDRSPSIYALAEMDVQKFSDFLNSPRISGKPSDKSSASGNDSSRCPSVDGLYAGARYSQTVLDMPRKCATFSAQEMRNFRDSAGTRPGSSGSCASILSGRRDHWSSGQFSSTYGGNSSSSTNSVSRKASPRYFSRTDDEPRAAGESTRFVIRETL